MRMERPFPLRTNPIRSSWPYCVALLMISSAAFAEVPFQTPISYEAADARAGKLLARMSTEEKLQLVSGYNSFFIHGFPRLGIPALRMSDATQGLRLKADIGQTIEKSTAFPAPIGLAATWNPDLAYRYARSIGEECRAGDVAILLGPGMDNYRVSQCGRNFEYFGEDPLLAARMVERYVRGILDTGTIPTLKHFVANDTDFYRRTSNSVVDERTLHEINLPAFKAGIDAGAMAVMTSYNQLDGEWCGQSHYVITDLLRGSLGFRWLVMTDWHSVWDAQKIIPSGQDLEMPGNSNIASDAARLLGEGKVEIADIDRMARAIMRTCIAMGLYDRPVRDDGFREQFPAHVQCALETARQGIVLLKNDGVLPLEKSDERTILVTGLFVDDLARGGGSARVEGYDVATMRQALSETYGGRVSFVAEPTDDQLRSAGTVLVSTGTFDSEGSDRPFALPDPEERRVERAVGLNMRTVVIINSGGGIRMTGWNDRAAAVICAWYPGQVGNRALAEVLCGDTNPSGRLPISIERRFEDSPGYGYIPQGEALYKGKPPIEEMRHPVYTIKYSEGVFVGYRWYESRKITPLYAFGSGLSYTSFAFASPRVSAATVLCTEGVSATCRVTNTGTRLGAEVVQLYVRPIDPPVHRPEKELKGFARVELAPGESREVTVTLTPRDFAYWDVDRHDWTVAPGDYELLIGGASDQIALRTKVTLR
jgi:beta-glucosidase